MNTITYIEKLVLYAIIKGHSTLEHIQEVTGLSPFVLNKITQRLYENELIKINKNIFLPRISAKHSTIWAPHKEEVFNIINLVYQKKKNFNFSLAKFSRDDFIEYTHLSKRLENFIRDCNNKNHTLEKDSRYIFWGQIPQAQAIQYNLAH